MLPTFREALEANKAMVYSIAWNILHDRQAAEEIAQDVFLQLHQNWQGIESPAHLVFWLRRAATHRSIDAARKRKTQAETSLDDSGEPTIFEQLHDTLLSAYLARMVASLPENQRAAIVLRYQEDLDIGEIARLLDQNNSTIKTNIARGLELLRNKIGGRLGRGNRT